MSKTPSNESNNDDVKVKKRSKIKMFKHLAIKRKSKKSCSVLQESDTADENKVEISDYLNATQMSANINPNHPPVPPPLKPKPKLENVKTIFVAIYNYVSQESDELSFIKDDEIVSLEDFGEKDWFSAQNERTKETGLVPKIYLRQKNFNEFESLEGYLSINRIEAEKMLQAMNIPVGSYIIRPCQEEGNFALSVRSLEKADVDRYCVKHFKIKKKDEKYTLDGNRQFNLIQELIDFLKKDNDITNIKLTNPAPKEPPDVSFKLFEVEKTNFIIYDELGQGNFGSVYKAKWGIRSRNFVAIKVVKPGKMSIENFLGEAEIMHKMRHPNIVKLLAISTKPEHEPIYIVTEFMENGDLLNYLRKTETRKIDFGKMLKMILQIADGMAYLEHKNYIHRDLRAANVLVDENVIVKVADFGLSSLTNNENQETAIKKGSLFPVRWTAPEVKTGRVASIKSDVWSFGVLIFEIVTYGSVPYANYQKEEILDLIVKKDYRMPNPHKMKCSNDRKCKCPNELYEQMLNCWKINPADRPSFDMLKSYFIVWDREFENKNIYTL